MLARSHAAELPRPRVIASKISKPEVRPRARPVPTLWCASGAGRVAYRTLRTSAPLAVRRRLYALSSLFDWYLGSN
jgi:hypothetical protein